MTDDTDTQNNSLEINDELAQMGSSIFNDGNIAFVNQSNDVSNTELSNAADNLYNNSPRFKLMMDELSSLNIPIAIVIKDEKSNDTYAYAQVLRPTTQLDPETEAANKELHALKEKNENGVIPDKDGSPAETGIVFISTRSFTHFAYGADKDQNGKIDDIDNDQIPDKTIPISFEQILTHELYHVLDGVKGSTLNNNASELDASEFEYQVMKEIHRPNINQHDPAPRAYNEPLLLSSEREPNILNTSRPSPTETPWEWNNQSQTDIQPRPQPAVGVPREWQPSPGETSEVYADHYDDDPILANMGIEDSAYASDFNAGTDPYYDEAPALANIENSSFYNEGSAVSNNVENSAFAGNWVTEQQSNYDDITPDEPMGPVVSTPDSFSV